MTQKEKFDSSRIDRSDAAFLRALGIFPDVRPEGLEKYKPGPDSSKTVRPLGRLDESLPLPIPWTKKDNRTSGMTEDEDVSDDDQDDDADLSEEDLSDPALDQPIPGLVFEYTDAQMGKIYRHVDGKTYEIDMQTARRSEGNLMILCIAAFVIAAVVKVCG